MPLSKHSVGRFICVCNLETVSHQHDSIRLRTHRLLGLWWRWRCWEAGHRGLGDDEWDGSVTCGCSRYIYIYIYGKLVCKISCIKIGRVIEKRDFLSQQQALWIFYHVLSRLVNGPGNKLHPEIVLSEILFFPGPSGRRVSGWVAHPSASICCVCLRRRVNWPEAGGDSAFPHVSAKRGMSLWLCSGGGTTRRPLFVFFTFDVSFI